MAHQIVLYTHLSMHLFELIVSGERTGREPNRVVCSTLIAIFVRAIGITAIVVWGVRRRVVSSSSVPGQTKALRTDADKAAHVVPHSVARSKRLGVDVPSKHRLTHP